MPSVTSSPRALHVAAHDIRIPVSSMPAAVWSDSEPRSTTRSCRSSRSAALIDRGRPPLGQVWATHLPLGVRSRHSYHGSLRLPAPTDPSVMLSPQVGLGAHEQRAHYPLVSGCAHGIPDPAVHDHTTHNALGHVGGKLSAHILKSYNQTVHNHNATNL